MTMHHNAIAAWTDFLPESIAKHLDGPSGILILLGVGAVAIFLLAWVASLLWKMLFGTGVGKGPKEKTENLADYPPAPPPGAQLLYIDGQPVRVRFIVVAPVGGQIQLTNENVEQYLEQVIPGLGSVAQSDKPRIAIWPTQLSQQGFAPTFHRLTEKPEPDGTASRWVLLAGPAAAGKQKILLGVALLAEQENVLGRRTMQPDRWPEMLQVKNG